MPPKKKRKRIAKATLMLAVVLLALVVGSGGTAFAQIGSVSSARSSPALPPETTRCS